ncbi:putative Syntaxin-8 [Hypsibius exemplaris]|uniref:Syntaxin-8 n=1 Tax=Hypsibius exemplaris TaxID=2072580 RepID=A0A1W0X525_HYPEX|nr:putative Syntaxin-8 [Hypsibius exemplaris]
MGDHRDAWLTSCAATEKLGAEIMDKISHYHQELAKNSASAASLSTSIRTLMKKFSSSTASLRQTLTRSVVQSTISANESERRQALLDDLITTEKRLEQAFAAKTTASHNRSNLLGTTSSGYGSQSANPWLMGEETDETRAVSTYDIRAQHQHVLKEQDRGLDALSKAVGRQREIAVDIAAEVDIHNDILGEISEEMERADGRLARETRNMKVILKKSKTHWCMWLLIVLLLIAIVTVAAVPAK